MSWWTGRKVLVTGGRGFLGRHVTAALSQAGAAAVALGRAEYDLTDPRAAERAMGDHQPELVIHLAGLVGGILPNRTRPAEFFLTNLLVGTYMLHAAYCGGAKKFVAAGAGCGYPEHAPIPLKESAFWDGLPQPDSAPYSLAKRLLTVQSQAYWAQYRFASVVCIPGNVYGPHDNFNLQDAHVVPALVRKFVEAAAAGAASVEVWGTGTASRDFVYAGDVAAGMLRAAECLNESDVINISSGVESRIGEVVDLLVELTGFRGRVIWNRSKPEGQARRWFDVSKARERLGFVAPTGLREGLGLTVEWFQANRSNPQLRL